MKRTKLYFVATHQELAISAERKTVYNQMLEKQCSDRFSVPFQKSIDS